jgi:hypothetical protein
MEKKFKVGDRVGTIQYCDEGGRDFVLRYDEYNEPAYGTITEIDEEHSYVLTVRFDGRDSTETIDLEYAEEDEIILLAEDKMKSKWSSLEKTFKEIQKDIRDKTKEAAKLLRQANKIALKSGNSLADISGVVGDLYSAMDECGWRTSSFGC